MNNRKLNIDRIIQFIRYLQDKVDNCYINEVNIEIEKFIEELEE